MTAVGYTASGLVRKDGDTMTGLLVLSGNPGAALGAAPKQYVDASGAGAAAALALHEADTTAVHGITDTAGLETSVGAAAKVTAHTGAADPHGDRAFTTAAVSTHAGAADPHADRAFTTTAVTTHAGAADPHGDRAFTTAAVATHAAAVDPHGDRAFTTAAVATHTAAADPHGDRAFAVQRANHTGTQPVASITGLANSATLPVVVGNKTGGDQAQSSASLADVTGVGMAVAGAGTFDFEFFVPYTGDTNGNSPITVNVTGPAVSLASYDIYMQNSNTGKTEAVKTALNSSQAGAAVTTAGTIYAVWIRGRIIATAGGTLQLQFAGDGTHTCTVKAGAYGTLRQVA